MTDIRQVWMSHGDQLSAIPPEFHVVGTTDSAPFAAIAHDSKPFYGIQFHPEVTHSPMGKAIIGRFILNVCGCRQNWTMVSHIPRIIIWCSHYSKGRVYWKGSKADPGNGRTNWTSDWRSQRRGRQHRRCKAYARSNRGSVRPPHFMHTTYS